MNTQLAVIDININYDNRRFRALYTSPDDDTETLFQFSQCDNVVTATFSGGNTLYGSLIAVMDKNGCLDMRYQYINQELDLVTGICHATPTLLADGCIRLYKRWHRTSGNMQRGHTILEEILPDEEVF
ncbi:MAG TPA: n-acetylglutamate synthase [Patescibacteria group bacterium]|nr:n-acetylglutamate synthase [Patescibacteria group bacterium]